MTEHREGCGTANSERIGSTPAMSHLDRDGDGTMLGGVLIYAAAFMLTVILKVCHLV